MVVTALTVTGEAAAEPVFVTPPSVDVQVAVLVVTELPLLTAAVNDTTSDPVAVVVEPETAVTDVGAAGAPTITAADATDALPAPRELDALTVHV